MRHKILMVYPQHGFSGVFVRHAPLSLLYASAELVKGGAPVEIFDVRLHQQTWREELRKRITPDVLVVGISVMTGKPIPSASEISRFVKSIDPAITVVWGGPHATFYPETILRDEPNCDYVVSGYASVSFKRLVDHIEGGTVPSEVSGVSCRAGAGIVINPPENGFEHIHFKDIPYHLIADYTVYGQLDSHQIIFSLYSVYGCPYQCAFCSSPAQYAKFPKRWQPLEAREVVDHIEYVAGKYAANYMYFIDDDSFVNLKHVEAIIDEILRRNIRVTLGFRGARINEILKMSDAFIDKLSAAGTDMMHIGAECGSDRLLKLIRKNCTVADILEVNRKLARHPNMRVGYNFIVGIPSETMEDLERTKQLMVRLVEENPHCIIFQPNKFRPVPGTELFEIAQREWQYAPPDTLEAWGEIEVEGDFTASWYTEGMKQYCDLLLLGSYFIDDKIIKVTKGDTLAYGILRLLSRLYAPVIRFRLKYNLYQWLVEYRLYQFASRYLARHGSLLKPKPR